jgi:hypothetical protein
MIVRGMSSVAHAGICQTIAMLSTLRVTIERSLKQVLGDEDVHNFCRDNSKSCLESGSHLPRIESRLTVGYARGVKACTQSITVKKEANKNSDQ